MSRRISLVESLGISDVEGGDLGLGFGRKPGGIVISDEENNSSAEEEEEEEDLFDDLFAFSSGADGLQVEQTNRWRFVFILNAH